MMNMTNPAAVFCGGLAGALCRYTGNMALTAWAGPGFPWGILCINVLGGLLIGLLQGCIARTGRPYRVCYNLLGTGFLGGFTTFSTFSLDTLVLWQQGTPLLAAANIVANAALCVLAAGAGFLLAARGAARPTRGDSARNPLR